MRHFQNVCFPAIIFDQPPKVLRVLFSHFIISVIYTAGIELYGPFLRSMVKCEAVSLFNAEFTGSIHCSDKNYVLSMGQAREGNLVSMKLFVHAVAAPLLGSLADQNGRKPILLVSLWGFTFALVLFSMTAFFPMLDSTPLLMVGFIIQGATNTFNVVYSSIIADLTTPQERASAFTAYHLVDAMACIVAELLSVCILWTSPSSYSVVWFAFSLVVLVDVLFSWHLIAESHNALGNGPKRRSPFLPPRRPLAGLVVRAMSDLFQLVRLDGFLHFWLLSVLMSGFAEGVSVVFASFTVAVYGWHAGNLQAYTCFKSLLKMACLSLSPAVNNLCPSRVFLLQLVISGIASFVRVFAQFSPALLLTSIYVSNSLAFATPATVAFLSMHFNAENQAKVNALQNFSSNIGTSISFAVFSSQALFRPEAGGIVAMRPFLLALVLTVASGILRVWLAGLKETDVHNDNAKLVSKEMCMKHPLSCKITVQADNSSSNV